MDLKNNPVAYWSFETGLLKEDVRDIMSSVACETLRLSNPRAYTPWRINLFRIEEFEKYHGLAEQYEHLNHLRGWEGPDEETDLLSSSDMLRSYFEAQKFIKNDSNFEKFVKKSKETGLNYIINAVHDGNIPSASNNGSVEVLSLLSDLSLKLFDTQIKQESKDLRNQLFGYYENSESSNFILINGSGKELSL